MPASRRRESILSAATDVCAQAGYQRGKVSAVAARIGVSEPVILQNFGSKSTLFATVLERATGRLCASLRHPDATGGSVTEFLAEVLSSRHLNALHSQGSVGVLFADAMDLNAEPTVADAARATVAKVADALADLAIESLVRSPALGDLGS
ncbi:TetR/AcrR family transcriptional regulator [Streptomyces pinistramenti]|uniref:TetR/AcrR family transcriptional regulator n=1 Tax=Streptomyces pinistramenti TaxID=2884812 RepID=UPI001D06D4FA|nr:TetR/AcrR family transcriptional regulator [Streptomyces pinistramenti]MCB5910011.1 TetR/AcrR family transcriptional regulator [Streptomyces pinistramenti]